MATTYVDYTATASQTDFAFNFEYLEDEHVIVEINGTAQLSSAFSIVTSPAKKVVLNVGATAGDVVRVRRKSQPDTNLVDFVNGSVLTESELDRAYLHNRYLNEEIAELNDSSLQIEAGGTDWDARSKKIKNLAAPTLTTDATTKDYVDGKVNQAASGTSSPPLKWVFTGTAGANTTYTVTGAEINGDTAYDVSSNGSVLEPTTDYTVDPNTDTLTIKTTLTGGEDIVIIQRGFGIPISTGEIGSAQISADSITTAKIADSAVTAAKIGANAVTTAKIADSAVTTAKIADGSVTNAKLATPYVHPNHTGDVTGSTALTIANDAVTFAKMQNISTATVIGRTTAGSGDPEAVSILDEDTMTSDSATALATQQSIKAYVDAQIGGWNFTNQTVSSTLSPPNTFTDLDLSSFVGTNSAYVIFEASGNTSGYSLNLNFRKKGSTYDAASGIDKKITGSGIGYQLFGITDSSGVIQYRQSDVVGTGTITLKIIGYVK